MNIPPVKHWLICLSGFLQHEGKPTGMVRLWRHLAAEHADARTHVCLRTWDDSADHLAELIWRLRENGAPRICIFAYSYGGGWAAPRLARELDKRGLGVEHLVLSDPVYRSPRLALRWLSLTRWPRIVVPPNVRQVTVFRQRLSRPAGHDVSLADPRTTRLAGHYLARAAHVYMDDLRAFHRACLAAARAATAGPH